jgi:hypothetical protein
VPPPIEAAPLPQPAPAPAQVRVASPLVGIAPGSVAAPAGLQLAVIAGGVRLPTFDVAQAAPVDERPIARAGSEAGESAFLPAEIKPVAPTRPAPVVPVYPRKQARH